MFDRVTVVSPQFQILCFFSKTSSGQLLPNNISKSILPSSPHKKAKKTFTHLEEAKGTDDM
jgi:hypothetical protein